MIFIYKMASGVRMSKNWIPRLRFLFLSFSQYVADYSDPRSRPFPGKRRRATLQICCFAMLVSFSLKSPLPVSTFGRVKGGADRPSRGAAKNFSEIYQ